MEIFAHPAVEGASTVIYYCLYGFPKHLSMAFPFFGQQVFHQQEYRVLPKASVVADHTCFWRNRKTLTHFVQHQKCSCSFVFLHLKHPCNLTSSQTICAKYLSLKVTRNHCCTAFALRFNFFYFSVAREAINNMKLKAFELHPVFQGNIKIKKV